MNKTTSVLSIATFVVVAIGLVAIPSLNEQQVNADTIDDVKEKMK